MNRYAAQAAAAVCLVVMATGCNALRPTPATTVKGSQATAVRQEIRNQQQDYTTIQPAQPAADTSYAADTAAADTMQAPPPVQPVHAPVEAITMASPLARALGGEWQIIQVGATTIDRDEDMPYIVFQPSAASFYANNGCNTLNGAYAVAPDDKITFYNVLSTMRLCPGVTFDSDINAIIADGVSTALKLSEVGQETFVDFVNPAGKTIMRLRRGNLEFLNGQWDVESITGLSRLQAPADIFIDLAELKLHGNTGCNFVNGTIYLDHRRPGAIDFSNMGTTRMACPYNDQQTAMLVALEQTETAISDGNDRVMLLDGAGRRLMTLRRAAREE